MKKINYALVIAAFHPLLASAQIPVAQGVCRFSDRSLAAEFTVHLTGEPGLSTSGKIWNASDTVYRSVKFQPVTYPDANGYQLTTDPLALHEAKLGNDITSLTLLLPKNSLQYGGQEAATLRVHHAVASCQGHDCDYWVRPPAESDVDFKVNCQVQVVD